MYGHNALEEREREKKMFAICMKNKMINRTFNGKSQQQFEEM